MKEQRLPHQLQNAKYVFYLEMLHFGVLKGIISLKTPRLWKNNFY